MAGGGTLEFRAGGGTLETRAGGGTLETRAGGGTLESRAGGSTLETRAGGAYSSQGWALFLWNDCFFKDKKWIYQENPIVLKKRTIA